MRQLNITKPFLDIRNPAPDTEEALADQQIRSQQLEEIKTHVQSSWPHVKSLRCRFNGIYLQFTVGITPWSPEEQLCHWELSSWMEQHFDIQKSCFLFLPPAVGDPVPGEVVIV